MNRIPSLTESADPTREMPARSTDRLDRIERALASLDQEERRLLRLGFELPLLRCREQRRYWQFVRGVCAMAGGSEQEAA
jgi:hypothetical protein